MLTKIQAHAFKPAVAAAMLCASSISSSYDAPSIMEKAYPRLLLLAQAVVSAVALPFEVLLMALTLPLALLNSKHLQLSALCAFAHLAAIPLSLGLMFTSSKTIDSTAEASIRWLESRFNAIMR